MKVIAGKSLRGNSTLLFCETSLDDFLACAMLDLTEDSPDKSIQGYLHKLNSEPKAYHITVRLAIFDSVEYKKVTN